MIRAIWFPDPDSFDRHKTPGSFQIGARTESGLFHLVYYCPCGCGLLNRLLVGKEFKPGGARPGWRWNGSVSEPTLDPSVNVVGHWHGWLRNGYWRQA